MFASQFLLTNYTNQFLLVFVFFLVVLVALVTLIIRWALKENRARRELFNARARSTDQD
jgi:Flp pilus assembly protein TadB